MEEQYCWSVPSCCFVVQWQAATLLRLNGTLSILGLSHKCIEYSLIRLQFVWSGGRTWTDLAGFTIKSAVLRLPVDRLRLTGYVFSPPLSRLKIHALGATVRSNHSHGLLQIL